MNSVSLIRAGIPASWLLVGILVLSCPGQLAAQGADKPLTGPPRKKVSVNLPPERADRVKELQMEVKLETARLDELLRERRDQLDSIYRGYDVDEKRAEGLHQEIRQTQDQILKLHHRFQLDMRKLLTEPEFELLQRKFSTVRAEKMKHMKSLEKMKRLKSMEDTKRMKSMEEEKLLKPLEELKRIKSPPKPEALKSVPKEKTDLPK